jgi:hypothetical protein
MKTAIHWEYWVQIGDSPRPQEPGISYLNSSEVIVRSLIILAGAAQPTGSVKTYFGWTLSPGLVRKNN